MPPTKEDQNDEEIPRQQVEKRQMNRGPEGGGRQNKSRPNFPGNRGGQMMNSNPNNRGGQMMNSNPNNRGGPMMNSNPNIRRGGGGYEKYQIPGPTTNLPSNTDQKKYQGRCRLFVGNLTLDTEEEEFRNMFTEFGEVSELFLNRQKGFGFVKMDTKENAENAKATLDGQVRKGRIVRVRFATYGAALKLRNLSPWVSNELLETAFGLFGEVERAVHVVDERGRPTGKGIVEFTRKSGAQMALKRCNDGCFLLCSSPRPVIVEQLEQKDEEDGLMEKNIPRNSQFMSERDIGPRFSPPNSFEYEFSNRWKQLFLVEKQKREELEKEIKNDYDRLEEQMEFAIFEAETAELREKLRQREMDANILLREREMRRREQEHREQKMRRQEDMMRHGGRSGPAGHAGHGNPEEGMGGRGGGEEMRRRPEDNLFLQANHLNDLLAQQEAAIHQIRGSGSGNNGNGPGGNVNNSDNQGFEDQELSGLIGNAPPRQSRMGGPGPMGPMNEMRGDGGGGGMGRRELIEQRRENRDEYPVDMKRRRF